MLAVMNATEIITAEQFALRDCDFPQGGRWVELVAGRVVALEPPDQVHGSTVLNFSKALARHLQTSDDENRGYACYELGLIVSRNPDSVRCPAVSYFAGGTPFAELDKAVTETQPRLVVEVSSTADRRRSVKERVEGYLGWGVESVWIVDSVERRVYTFRQGGIRKQLAEHQQLLGNPVLPGFEIPVADLFVQPV